MSKKYQSTTEAELEAEFVERNNNLKRTWNNIVDKMDHAAKTTHDYLETPELKADMNSTVNNNGSLGAYKSSSSDYYNHATGTAGTLNTSMHNDNTRRRSSILGEQTSRTTHRTTPGYEINLADRKLMNSIYQDIHAMHSTDPEEFENIASKIDETFASNALV